MPINLLGYTSRCCAQVVRRIRLLLLKFRKYPEYYDLLTKTYVDGFVVPRRMMAESTLGLAD